LPQTIDPSNLASRIRGRRFGLGLTVRDAAEAAGVSPATFSRVERGDYVPGTENLLKLAEWLGVPLAELGADARLTGHEDEPQSTPEAVALHLRADKNLSGDDAAVLEQVFRSTYNALVKRKRQTQS
jgi:transcriptional regulator with XRE-family HTH domain